LLFEENPFIMPSIEKYAYVYLRGLQVKSQKYASVTAFHPATVSRLREHRLITLPTLQDSKSPKGGTPNAQFNYQAFTAGDNLFGL
jgi:hypothetical protein